jgi:hypothetical protein
LRFSAFFNAAMHRDLFLLQLHHVLHLIETLQNRRLVGERRCRQRQKRSASQ